MTDRLTPSQIAVDFLQRSRRPWRPRHLLPCTTAGAEQGDAVGSNKICVFTKPFNSLSFDELADRIAELGFDGIEAPIRVGGHVEPDQVEDRLPARTKR